jgi:hypothetical protein
MTELTNYPSLIQLIDDMKKKATKKKIEVDESGVDFIIPNGEEFHVCMRDGGYEFKYAGVWYRAVNGEIEPKAGNG